MMSVPPSLNGKLEIQGAEGRKKPTLKAFGQEDIWLTQGTVSLLLYSGT